MKVTNNPPAEATQVLEKTRTTRPGERSDAVSRSAVSPKVQSASQVEISDNARLLQKAVELVQGSNASARAEKIAALKDSIRNGTYSVDSERLADRIVEEHLLTNFGKNHL
ncbi:MAG: flagellar biosynthesis anti-sigma factor FlgM [Bdellovibrionales bacterium]|nr:flagellar biosynthesis anti-sigma factor FlgM [Bdellovibrionales bacterium]